MDFQVFNKLGDRVNTVNATSLEDAQQVALRDAGLRLVPLCPTIEQLVEIISHHLEKPLVVLELLDVYNGLFGTALEPCDLKRRIKNDDR